MYSSLKSNFRLIKAEMELSKLMTEDIQKAFNENKFGCICLKTQKFDLAEKHLMGAMDKLSSSELIGPFTNVLMNLGNLHAQLKKTDVAIEYYTQVITMSPYANEEHFKGYIWSNKLNSFDAYVDAHTNLACLLTNLDRPEEAYQYLIKAIELQPDNCEAQTNFGDLLRQLNRQQEAIEHTWKQIERFTQQAKQDYQRPQPINAKEVPPKQEDRINIICMKWGVKYNHEYVNKLYNGIKQNTTRQFNFICVTEDPSNLDKNILIRQLQQGWTGWWGKATLFGDYDYPDGKLFFIDLDMIITGNIDDILDYGGAFGILKTDEIACEKQNKNGINSSIMVWNNREVFKKVFDNLNDNWENISKFIVRFDFWLEMMIIQPDYLQDIYGGQIKDFVQECSVDLPQDTRIVCFPRMPKPHNYPAKWIEHIWI